jgi:hypothetical protein
MELQQTTIKMELQQTTIKMEIQNNKSERVFASQKKDLEYTSTPSNIQIIEKNKLLFIPKLNRLTTMWCDENNKIIYNSPNGICSNDKTCYDYLPPL